MKTSIGRAHQNRIIWFLVCAMGFFAIAVPLKSDAQNGKINGTVVDQRSRPIPHAVVVADRKGDTAELLIVADDSGRFSMDAGLGQYDVAVPLFVPSIQMVTLTQDKPVATVNFSVQEAADISLQLVDRATERSIGWAWVVVRRGDDYFKQLSFPMKERVQIAVPSNIDLTFSIFAPKYRLWTYRDRTLGDATLSVAAGQRAELKVSMDRIEPEVAKNP